MFYNKKSISNKLKDKKVTKTQRLQRSKFVYFTVEIEGLKTSGRFILWQPINFEILAWVTFLSYCYLPIYSEFKNKQKQRITWKQIHWFLVEKSSTNLKTCTKYMCVWTFILLLLSWRNVTFTWKFPWIFIRWFM